MTSHVKRTLALIAATAMIASAAHARTFDSIDIQTDTALSAFEKVYIAPIEIDFSEHRIRQNVRDLQGIRPVSERDQARKASDLIEDLQREFGKRYVLVDTPGADVLTVETTLTKLVSTRPTLADRRQTPTLDFSSVYAGGADFQVELIAGGTTLATIEDNQSRDSNFNDGRPRVGIWQDVDRSFNRFSRKLARYVSRN